MCFRMNTSPNGHLAERIRRSAKSKIEVRITAAARSLHGFKVQADKEWFEASTKLEALQMLLTKVQCVKQRTYAITKMLEKRPESSAPLSSGIVYSGKHYGRRHVIECEQNGLYRVRYGEETFEVARCDIEFDEPIGLPPNAQGGTAHQAEGDL